MSEVSAYTALTKMAMNDSNIDFYRNIQIDKFLEIALLQGFDNCPDVDLIWPHIKNAKNLVELGAGYGRVIFGLLGKGFKGNIHTIERSPELIRYLQGKLPEEVRLLRQDLKAFDIGQPADAVLYLWSGILELSFEEQQAQVKLAYDRLAPDGVLILEIPRKVRYVGVPTTEQQIRVETEWGRLSAFWPTHEQMVAFADSAGFDTVKLVEYRTDADLERSIYIYKKY